MASLNKVVVFFIYSLTLVQVHGINNALRDDINMAVERAANFIESHRSGTNQWHPLETPSAILGLISANPARRESEESKYDVIALKAALYQLINDWPANGFLSKIDSSTLVQFMSAFQTNCVSLRGDELGLYGSSKLWIEARNRLMYAERRSPAIPGLAMALCNDNLSIGSRIFRLLSLPQSGDQVVCSSLCVEKAALNLLALTCLRRDKESVWTTDPRFSGPLQRKLESNLGYINTVLSQPNYQSSIFDTVLLLQVYSVSSDFKLSDREVEEMYNRILSYQKSDGSFGGSVTLTAMVIPALTNFTMLDIGQRECGHQEQKELEAKINKGIHGPDDVLVKYMIEDQFSQSQTFVGDFATKKGTSLEAALIRFKIENKGIIIFETTETPFGVTLSSLMGIKNNQVATWKTYRNVKTGTRTAYDEKKVTDLANEIIEEDSFYVFKFEQVKGV